MVKLLLYIMPTRSPYQWPVDKVLPHIRYEGEDLRIADKTGKIWLENVAHTTAADPTQDTRPKVDRGILRQTYLDSVKEGTIHWGTHVKRIIPVEPQDGEGRPRYTLVFSNGEEETFDFVIGADGAWSRIPALISDAKPTYSGVTMVETRLLNVDEMHPAEAKVVGRGNMYAISDNKAVMAQRNGDGTIRNYVALRIPKNGLPEEEFCQESTAKAHLLGQFDD
ncbi:hypothetical protein EDD11_005929 [Mortierella claussenii]|nr:hypothetical protein EDD11_005929 [Mortierella claussenii]